MLAWWVGGLVLTVVIVQLVVCRRRDDVLATLAVAMNEIVNFGGLTFNL